jgi:Zn-dependent protease
MDPAIAIILIIALIGSVVIHEMAHGYMAYWLGDPTAKLSGRLSPNPIVHLDPLMSILVPGLLIMSSTPFIFGAAKPVPYNPYNLRDQKWGEAKIAVAGPVSNIILAIIFAVLVQVAPLVGLPSSFALIGEQVVYLNLFLAFFNLLPLPPLDGSKILPPLLGLVSTEAMMQYQRFRMWLEQDIFLGFAIVIFLVFYVLGGPLYALVQYLGNFLLHLL